MIAIEIGETIIEVRGALDFPLRILQADELAFAPKGTIPFKGVPVETTIGPNGVAWSVYSRAIDDATKWQKVWRATSRVVKASWRSAVWAVAGQAVGQAIGDLFMEEGMKDAFDRIGEMAQPQPNPETDPARRREDPCVYDRDQRSILMTFQRFEARREGGADSWINPIRQTVWQESAWQKGVLKVYLSLVESMLVGIAAAYIQTELGRNDGGGVRKKRVRASAPVRGVGRPVDDSGIDPREKGEWRRKHPVPR